MPSNAITRLFLISAVAGSLVATPALAQGKGNSNDRDRAKATDSRRGSQQRPELIRRSESRDGKQQRRNSKAQNGPAFCRSGAGHPVHGRRWCEDRGHGVYSTDRYDTRTTDRKRRGSSSYDVAHAEFHRQHDRQCSARAADRPLDLQHQVRVRNDCRQRHEEWHRRAGRSH